MFNRIRRAWKALRPLPAIPPIEVPHRIELSARGRWPDRVNMDYYNQEGVLYHRSILFTPYKLKTGSLTMHNRRLALRLPNATIDTIVRVSE